VLLFGGAPPLNCGSPTLEKKASFADESLCSMKKDPEPVACKGYRLTPDYFL
jgi:hypothetical protein